jgi:hypothetical protein
MRLPEVPGNSWILYKQLVDKADSVLKKTLDGKPMGPLLNQFIHLLVFRQGICVSRWIINNQELVTRLNDFQSFTREEFESLAAEVKSSVEKLSRT